MERRLAAILVTDIVDYSRLMAVDEAGTIVRQKAHRADVFDPSITAHGGRIVKSTGDGILVEFPSVVDAVNCAVKVQRAITDTDSEALESERIQYRIGINLGGIVIDDGDILGDGVNIAARLEDLAEPGGICISGSVHDQLGGKLDVVFDDGGEQTLKNVRQPVRVWRWGLNQSAKESIVTDDVLPHINKPSVAVMPFTNLSDDAEQDYFADGITEDIITELSRFRSLFVIDRHSVFAYKGESVKIQDVGKDLGVKYAVEGSVRKSGERVRITTQLVDAVTSKQVWAERYDRELSDIFRLQDEITETVVTLIEPQINAAEIEAARRRPPQSLRAWDAYQRGLWHLYRTTRSDNIEAQTFIERSIQLDAQSSSAFSGLSEVFHQQYALGWTKDVDKAQQRASSAARRAVAIDPYDAQAHVALGRALVLQGENEDALAEFREALDLNPNSALASYRLGVGLVYGGRARETLLPLMTAIRLSPRDPQRARFDRMVGVAHFMLAEHRDADPWFKRATRQSGMDYWSALGLAANYAALGDLELSKSALNEVLNARPDLTISIVADFLRRQNAGYNNYYIAQLRKAGLPDNL